MVKLVIPGRPIAKKRPRFARRGKFVKTYSEQETEEGRFLWEIKHQWQGQPLTGPLAVDIVFYFDRPKGHYGTGKRADILRPSAPEYMTSKPDLDNLEKFVADVLNGVAWTDDSQVVKSRTAKYYDTPARTEIAIRTVEEVDW